MEQSSHITNPSIDLKNYGQYRRPDPYHHNNTRSSPLKRSMGVSQVVSGEFRQAQMSMVEREAGLMGGGVRQSNRADVSE
jgi:hypothetical protein